MKLLALLIAAVPSIALATGGSTPPPKNVPPAKPPQTSPRVGITPNISPTIGATISPNFHDETNATAVSAAGAQAGAYGGYVGTVGNSMQVDAARAAYAPDVIAYPTAPCRVAIGGSAGWLGGAIGVTGSVLDENCSRIETSRHLHNLGHKEAAVQILCLSDEAKRALEATGVVCKLKAPEPPKNVGQ